MTTPASHAEGSAPTPPASDDASRSTFSLGELAGVCAHYDVGEIRGVYEFKKGSRRSPKVVLDTEGGRYLVKRRARGRDDPHRVAFCHDLQLYLRGAGFPSAGLIGTRRGNNSMVQLNDRVYELFEFVDGEPFDRTPGPCGDAGRLLARLHRLVREYQPRWPAPTWSYHDDTDVRARVDEIAARRIARAEAGELRRLYDQAAAQAGQGSGHPAAAQLLHGDWHPGNMIFRGDRVVAVLDFDGARSGPVAHDLAGGVLQFSLTRVGVDPDAWPDALDARRFAAFLRGYGSSAAGADLTKLPALMAEALVTEVVSPIATSGSFAGRDAAPFVRMALRKGRWLLEHSARLAALAERSTRGAEETGGRS